MSHTAEDLLIIYEPEARQWASYLCSVFAGHIPQDGICCFDITTVTPGRHHDFQGLERYRCKLLILSRALVGNGEGEGAGRGGCLRRVRRFFLSRVLGAAATVVVLLCGVESLAPLLDMVPLQGERCLLMTTEQDPRDYLAAVVEVVQGDAGGGGGGARRKKAAPGGAPALDQQAGRQTGNAKSVVSTTAVNSRTGPNRSSDSQSNTGNPDSPRAPDTPRGGLLVVPFRVPSGASGELFVLVRDKVASGDIEVEFCGGNRTRVRVKPERWNEHVLLVRTPDFPSGKVAVTLYCGARAVDTTQIQYYSPLDEISQLLTRVADPVDFMCQALRVSSLEKLDQKLASIVVQGMPSGGFQELGLLRDNTPWKGGPRPQDLPTLLHFAAQHAMRDLCGVLLQCPGARRALHTANRHGMTPGAIARRQGHAELHALLKEALSAQPPWSPVDDCVYEHMSITGSQDTAASLKDGEDGDAADGDEEDGVDEEDPYTLVGVNDEDYDPSRPMSPVGATPVAHRPPAPTPRPDVASPASLAMDGPTTFIAQVFKNKISKGNADMLNLPLAVQIRKASLTPPTYDTFVPGVVRPPAPVSGGPDGALSQPPTRVKRGSLTVNREELNHLRASVVNSRPDGDDSVYDQFNVVHPTKPTSACCRGAGPAESTEFYSKPRKGQHSHFLWKADKR